MRGFDPLSSHGRVKKTGRPQGQVAENLCIQPVTGSAAEEEVLRIGKICPAARILSESPARDHQAKKVLQVPASFLELYRQPVQQLGMSGMATLETKIVRRADQAFPENPLPDSVHEHSGYQRLIARGHPAGQPEAVTGSTFGHGTKRGGNAGQQRLADGHVVLAPLKELGNPWLG